MTLVVTAINLGEKMKRYLQVLTSFIKPQLSLFLDSPKAVMESRFKFK